METVLDEQRRGKKEKSVCKKARIGEGRGHRGVGVGRVMGRPVQYSGKKYSYKE